MQLTNQNGFRWKCSRKTRKLTVMQMNLTYRYESSRLKTVLIEHRSSPCSKKIPLFSIGIVLWEKCQETGLMSLVLGYETDWASVRLKCHKVSSSLNSEKTIFCPIWRTLVFKWDGTQTPYNVASSLSKCMHTILCSNIINISKHQNYQNERKQRKYSCNFNTNIAPYSNCCIQQMKCFPFNINVYINLHLILHFNVFHPYTYYYNIYILN